MEAYANWVRRNKDYLQSLESLANGLTWFVPDRFASSEIGLEAVSSFVGMISVINQYIVDTPPTQCPVVPRERSPFPYSLCISVMKELEILVEVAAEHYHGDNNKWNFIAITEGIKVLLRLSLFKQSGYKMLLHGGGVLNTESEGDASDSQNKIRDISKTNGLQSSSLHLQKPCGVDGRVLSALTQMGQNARMLYDSTLVNRTHHQVHTVEQPGLGRPTVASILSEKGICGGGLFLMGETLFILRPFIYVLFIKKYGWRSWTPWIASLVVDLVGMFASLQATRCKQNSSKQILLSIADKDELKRRQVLWALYVMRDPFFCEYTRKKAESTQKVLEPIPIVGMFTEKLFELLFGVQSRFSYISGS